MLLLLAFIATFATFFDSIIILTYIFTLPFAVINMVYSMKKYWISVLAVYLQPLAFFILVIYYYNKYHIILLLVIVLMYKTFF
jgi:hypothetical protein